LPRQIARIGGASGTVSKPACLRNLPHSVFALDFLTICACFSISDRMNHCAAFRGVLPSMSMPGSDGKLLHPVAQMLRVPGSYSHTNIDIELQHFGSG
jgi:hypothetical protein